MTGPTGSLVYQSSNLHHSTTTTRRGSNSILCYFWVVLAFSLGLYAGRIGIDMDKDINVASPGVGEKELMSKFVGKKIKSMQSHLDQSLEKESSNMKKMQETLSKTLTTVAQTQAQVGGELESILSALQGRKGDGEKEDDESQDTGYSILKTLQEMEQRQAMQLTEIQEKLRKLQSLTNNGAAENVAVAAPTTAASKEQFFASLASKFLDEYGWPNQTPTQIFPNLNKCQVIFKDPNMATCHLGAFGGNFGDMLGPDLVKRAVEYKYGCDASNLWVHDYAYNESFYGICLMTVGSVWRNVKPHDHVWGTGMLGKQGKGTELQSSACRGFTKFNNVTVYSVRGPLTAAKLQHFCPDKIQAVVSGKMTSDLLQVPTAGDAGFLIPFLFPEYRRLTPGTQECVILHKYDEELYTANSTDDIEILPVVQSWHTMVGNITQRCKVVSSSSLHGLILSDALGIPARWIQPVSSSIPPFKFQDYFSSYGVNKTGMKIGLVTKQSWSLDIPLSQTELYRSNYAWRIMETFPFELFTTTAVAPHSLLRGSAA